MRRIIILALASAFLSAFTIKKAPATSDYSQLVRTYEQMFRLPPGLLFAVVKHESNFNPKAVNGSSHGLGQINKVTARALCNMSVNTLHNPSANLYCSAKILRRLLDTHRAISPTLSAYNAGSPCECDGRRYVRRDSRAVCRSRRADETISCRQRGVFLNQKYVDTVTLLYKQNRPKKAAEEAPPRRTLRHSGLFSAQPTLFSHEIVLL